MGYLIQVIAVILLMILMAIAFSAVALEALAGIAVWLGILDLMVSTFVLVVSCAFIVDFVVGFALARLVTRDWAQNRWQEFALLAGGAFVVVLVTSLPGIGGIAKLVVIVMGLGAMAVALMEWWQRRHPPVAPPVTPAAAALATASAAAAVTAPEAPATSAARQPLRRRHRRPRPSRSGRGARRNRRPSHRPTRRRSEADRCRTPRSVCLRNSIGTCWRWASVEPELLRELREETAAMPEHDMQIAPEQGAFMALLVELIGAQALPRGGYLHRLLLDPGGARTATGRDLVCCDISREWTDVARRYWERAGVADKIELVLGPALDTLDAMLTDGQAGTFDFAFLDADKDYYPEYSDRLIALLRPGGLLAIDNVFWGGDVADPDVDNVSVRAIRSMNQALVEDPRVSLAMVPIADGLTLVRKH